MLQEKYKILIVDDDENARKTFGKVLTYKGYEVSGAGTCAEAIKLAQETFFNIALIDIHLPDANGIEVLKEINSINDETLGIMVTAYASIDTSIEAMNQGAFSYILKPANMDQVLVVIDKALEKQRLSIENKRLMEELKEANTKLKELDKLKSAFVAMVSHEFKNPLTVIIQSLCIILDESRIQVSGDDKKFLELARKNIERLIRLVSNLLDLSKIEAGKMELKREEIDIVSFLNEIIMSYENNLKEKSLSFYKDLPLDIGTIWADKDKLIEVVINLLNNAIKYTPEKGQVHFSVKKSDKEIRFEITDTGPGIPPEYKDKIFDKFERIAAEKEEGTGLGLPIAKEIVELHKGSIWVESESGKGSTFIFILPIDMRE